MSGDPGLSYYCSTTLTPNERRADLFSLNLIFDYAARQYDCFDEPGIFMSQFGIPYRMKDDTYKLFKNNNDLLF